MESEIPSRKRAKLCSKQPHLPPKPMEIPDHDVTVARKIIETPCAKSTAQRYMSCIRMYEEILKDLRIDPKNFDSSPTRNKSADPVAAALKLILRRCSPKEEDPSYENLSARSTGVACKSAVVAFWKSHGHYNQHTDNPDGSFSGNPGTAKVVQDLINKLCKAQLKRGTHVPCRAYQQTHEDVRAICTKYFDTVIERALQADPDIDYLCLQTAVVNCLQFGAVARADELLTLRMSDIIYSGDNSDSRVTARLSITKTTTSVPTKETHLIFERSVHRSFCSLEKLLLWKAVLLAHGITFGPLFLTVTNNVLQPGHPFLHSAYSKALKLMGVKCGIPGLQEHSARRGGLGYQYFVLRKDLLYLFKTFLWDDLSEMMKYLGLEDEVNSYALLGFSSLRVNEVR